jgi:Cu(I)/Ag(I) efflux system periplasmic protein CusF
MLQGVAMKNIFILFLLGASLTMQPAIADENAHAHQQSKKLAQKGGLAQCQSRTFHAVGTVRKIDYENSIVIMFHEPVADLMWPSMTMPFAIEDKALLDRIKVGERMNFEFVRDIRNGVIVGIK